MKKKWVSIATSITMKLNYLSNLLLFIASVILFYFVFLNKEELHKFKTQLESQNRKLKTKRIEVVNDKGDVVIDISGFENSGSIKINNFTDKGQKRTYISGSGVSTGYLSLNDKMSVYKREKGDLPKSYSRESLRNLSKSISQIELSYSTDGGKIYLYNSSGNQIFELPKFN